MFNVEYVDLANDKTVIDTVNDDDLDILTQYENEGLVLINKVVTII